MIQLKSMVFKRGTFLLLDGAQSNDRFYIIQSGKVGCTATLGMGQSTGRVLSTGDFVGVIPCMSDHSQMENVIALTDVHCIAIQKDQYPILIENNPSIAIKIIKAFAKRTRTMNEQYTRLTLRGLSVENANQIYNVAKYYDDLKMENIAAFAYYTYIMECPNGFDIDRAKARYNALRATATLRLPKPDEKEVEYKAGTMIMCEGQRGNQMFSIKSGQVAITKIIDGSEVVLAVLDQGGMFGEMALLEDKPRSASAIAREDCVLKVIARSNFDNLTQTQPNTVARLTAMLADRLWFMYKQLSCALLKEPLHRVVGMLALQLEKEKQTTGPYLMNLSVQDLVNMCGLTKEEQEIAREEFLKKNITVEQNGRMYIPSIQSVLAFDVLYKRQEAQARHAKDGSRVRGALA